MKLKGEKTSRLENVWVNGSHQVDIVHHSNISSRESCGEGGKKIEKRKNEKNHSKEWVFNHTSYSLDSFNFREGGFNKEGSSQKG